MGVKSAMARGLSSGLEPGLVLLGTQSFSGVGSFSLPANTFTSTYDTYRVTVSSLEFSSNPNVNMRFRKAGTDNTGTYRIGGVSCGYASSWTSYNTAGNGALLSSVSGANAKSSLDLTIYDVNKNRVTSFVTQSTNLDTMHIVSGIHDVVDTFDSMTVVVSTGTFTGTYSVYGFNK